MASPILISNPSSSVSVLAIVRGIQLALLGGYRSLQNRQLYEIDVCCLALRLIQISIIIQIILWTPTYFCRFATYLLSYLFNRNLAIDFDVDYLLSILNMNYMMISSIRFFEPRLDGIFLMTLLFMDNKSDQQYYANLMRLSFEHNEDLESHISILTSIKRKYNNSIQFRKFVKTNTKTILSTLSIYLMCKKSSKLESILIVVLTFQNFDDKIGTVSSLILLVILSIIPKHHSLQFITIFGGSCSLMQDLLNPYFTRISLNKLEKNQWVRSREGLVLGFSICYFLIIRKLPWLGLLIYGIAEASTAYLVTKISNPPPEQPKQLINWCSTQLIWSVEEQSRILDGNFIFDKNFKPFPGSFFFYPPPN